MIIRLLTPFMRTCWLSVIPWHVSTSCPSIFRHSLFKFDWLSSRGISHQKKARTAHQRREEKSLHNDTTNPVWLNALLITWMNRVSLNTFFSERSVTSNWIFVAFILVRCSRLRASFNCSTIRIPTTAIWYCDTFSHIEWKTYDINYANQNFFFYFHLVLFYSMIFFESNLICN